MRNAMHCFLCLIATAFWAIGTTIYVIACALVVCADKVKPEAVHGNCWTFAAPKFVKHGGYLLIRPADGQRFLKSFPVPHVIWVKSLPENTVVEQFIPVKRMYGSLMPWHTVYYKGKVIYAERKH